MKMWSAVGVLTLTLVSCSQERSVGLRYEAKRDVSKLIEREELLASDRSASDEDWMILASVYMGFADTYLAKLAPQDTSAARESVEYGALQAMLRAAGIYGGRLENAEEANRVMESASDRFAHSDQLTGHIALRRARESELQGRLGEAAQYYLEVSKRIEPDVAKDQRRIESQVFGFPRRAAELYRMSHPEDEDGQRQYFAKAIEYYRRYLGAEKSWDLRIYAQLHLAHISRELGNVRASAAMFDTVETWLLQEIDKDSWFYKPGEARLARVELLNLAGVPPESTRVLLESIRTDFGEEDPLSARAATDALVLNALRRSQYEEALGWIKEFDKEERSPRALELKAQVLRDQLAAYAANGDTPPRGLRTSLLDLYRALRSTYPYTKQGLDAYMLLAQLHWEAGEITSTIAALHEARNAYADFIRSYQDHENATHARRNLLKVLDLLIVLQPPSSTTEDELRFLATQQQDYGKDQPWTEDGRQVLRSAIENWLNPALNDAPRALAVCGLIQDLYPPRTEFGKWAAAKADSIRQAGGEQ